MIRSDGIRARERLRRQPSARCVRVHLAVRNVSRTVRRKSSYRRISVRNAVRPGDSVKRKRIISAQLRVVALRLHAWRKQQNQTHQYPHTYLLHFFLACWLGTQHVMKIAPTSNPARTTPSYRPSFRACCRAGGGPRKRRQTWHASRAAVSDSVVGRYVITPLAGVSFPSHTPKKWTLTSPRLCLSVI